MMIYRSVRDARNSMDELHGALRSAMLSTDTREVTTYANNAQATTDRLLRTLEDILSGRAPDVEESQGVKVERTFVQAALNALNKAWSNEEKVALGTSVADMRERLFDVKTDVDHADAYLTAALGLEEEG